VFYQAIIDMKLKILFCTLAAAIGLCSCGGASYQPLHGGFYAFDRGYTDQPIDSTSHEVSFYGSSGTSLDQVNRYALFRAAEVTLARGFEYFSVVETHSAQLTPASQIYSVVKTIQLFKGQKPTNAANVFNAKSMIETMSPTIER
jgi:hypothetical protein